MKKFLSLFFILLCFTTCNGGQFLKPGFYDVSGFYSKDNRPSFFNTKGYEFNSVWHITAKNNNYQMEQVNIDEELLNGEEQEDKIVFLKEEIYDETCGAHWRLTISLEPVNNGFSGLVIVTSKGNCDSTEYLTEIELTGKRIRD